jgi:hypothetical protein
VASQIVDGILQTSSRYNIRSKSTVGSSDTGVEEAKMSRRLFGWVLVIGFGVLNGEKKALTICTYSRVLILSQATRPSSPPLKPENWRS